MTDTARLVVNGYVEPQERSVRIVSILGSLANVPDGHRFEYRGMELEKRVTTARARREPELAVYDPDGEFVDQFQPLELSSYGIVEMLDTMRAHWVETKRATSL